MSSTSHSAPAKLDRGQVFETVKSIVAEHATFSAAEIRPEHHLENDLGCDSLDIVEISMEIEEHFDISIPDEISEQTKTVETIVDGVMQLLGKNVKA